MTAAVVPLVTTTATDAATTAQRRGPAARAERFWAWRITQGRLPPVMLGASAYPVRMTQNSGSMWRTQWNIANAVTAARILMVPFVAWALLVDGGDSAPWRWVATVLFVVAAATDKVDGHLARSRGLVTDLGKLLDPIADKALIGTALVGLSLLGELWWWVTIVILVRELGITAMRLLVMDRFVLAASRGGKLKTVLQSVALSILLLPRGVLPELVHTAGYAVMGLAVVVTLVTGLDYVVRTLRNPVVREGHA